MPNKTRPTTEQSPANFWTCLPSIEDTNGHDIDPAELVRLADFCLHWRKLYDLQRKQGENEAASTTKARRARAVKLLAHAAGARGLNELAIMSLIENPDASTDELLRLRGMAWRESKSPQNKTAQKPTNGKGGRLKKGEANAKVLEFIKLKERPDLTLAEVHDGTKLAKSTISNTSIWKEYDAQAKAIRDKNAAAMRDESEGWEFDNER